MADMLAPLNTTGITLQGRMLKNFSVTQSYVMLRVMQNQYFFLWILILLDKDCFQRRDRTCWYCSYSDSKKGSDLVHISWDHSDQKYQFPCILTTLRQVFPLMPLLNQHYLSYPMTYEKPCYSSSTLIRAVAPMTFWSEHTFTKKHCLSS